MFKTVLFVLVIYSGLCFSDVIILKDGKRLDGTIMKFDEKEIRIKTKNGVFVIDRTRIKSYKIGDGDSQIYKKDHTKAKQTGYYSEKVFTSVRSIHFGSWYPISEPMKSEVGMGFIFGINYRIRGETGIGGDMSFDMLFKSKTEYGDSTNFQAITFMLPLTFNITYGLLTNTYLIPYAGAGVNFTLASVGFVDGKKEIEQNISGTSIGFNIILGTDILFSRYNKSRAYVELRLNANTAQTEWEQDFKNYKAGNGKLNIHGFAFLVGIGF